MNENYEKEIKNAKDKYDELSFQLDKKKSEENKKKTYTKIKNNNNSLLQRINKEKDKFKEKDEIRQRNSITALNSINFNLGNNNINKKLRPSTPGLRKKKKKIKIMKIKMKMVKMMNQVKK